ADVAPLHPLGQILLPLGDFRSLRQRVIHFADHFGLPRGPHLVAVLPKLLRQGIQFLLGVLALSLGLVDVLLLGFVRRFFHVLRRVFRLLRGVIRRRTLLVVRRLGWLFLPGRVLRRFLHFLIGHLLLLGQRVLLVGTRLERIRCADAVLQLCALVLLLVDHLLQLLQTGREAVGLGRHVLFLIRHRGVEVVLRALVPLLLALREILGVGREGRHLPLDRR